MRLLVIDNYDSFTYNLVQYFGELLAEVDVFRNDAILVQDIDTSNYNGVVISPGPCDPTRAGISLEVIEKLKRRYNRNLGILEDREVSDIQETFINAMTHSFDPHSSFLSTHTLESFNSAVKNSFVGIGAH